MSLGRGAFPLKYDPFNVGSKRKQGTRPSRGRLITTLLIYGFDKGEIILCRGSDGGVSSLGC